jgi:RHS repeat-associated protein
MTEYPNAFGPPCGPYSYLANSSLVGQIVFNSNTVARMTTSKQYDYLNRLTSISSTPSNSFAYLYNSVNQRIMDRLADSSYWRYGYDSLGQVIQGEKYWVDETPVAGQQFDYSFDTIGNRIETQAGGDQNGANLRIAFYTNNSVNQITNRTVPGDVDIMGIGIATNTVTVNGTTAYRKNEYFRQQLSVTNTSAVWDSITITNGSSTNTGHLYVAETPETYTYDADGNLLNDGRWNYTWDGENRLLSMTSLSGAPSGSLFQLNFVYDYMGRRIQKMVSTNNGMSYVGEYTNKYAYDNWNCLAAMNSSLALSNTFMWGTDLSGSMRGAGGVGGLLKLAYYGTTTTNCFVTYDANGNVSALINAADGNTIANYEYGPFGEVIRQSGPIAKLNPFRFSSKYDDDETDLVYYGYRYYTPGTGRWLSRDPLEELGFQNLRNSRLFMLRQTINRLLGKNLYCLLNNQPISDLDVLGLGAVAPCGFGLQYVKMKDFSYRKSTAGVGLTDLIPWKEISKVLEAVAKLVDDVKTANGIFGEEINHGATWGCVLQCFVPTCQTSKVTNTHWDTEGDGYSIDVVYYWTVEIDYSYGPSGFIPPTCVNQNAPPPMQPNTL